MSTVTFDLDRYLTDLRHQIDQAFHERLPIVEAADPLNLRRAMARAVLEGGKRLRPCLTLAACEAVGGHHNDAIAVACAVELVHSYSLVHDDLPAMDNDDLRRGQPTCHKAFGEATAILVGDSLLTLAFEFIATAGIKAPERALHFVRASAELAKAAGVQGMVGGQALDMSLKDTTPSFQLLELCHSGKTAALFSAATALGGYAAGASDADIDHLRNYGFDLGLAFQHADDLRDNEFTTHRDRAFQRATELAQRAAKAAQTFGDRGAPLVAMAELVLNRAREGIKNEVPTAN